MPLNPVPSWAQVQLWVNPRASWEADASFPLLLMAAHLLFRDGEMGCARGHEGFVLGVAVRAPFGFWGGTVQFG